MAAKEQVAFLGPKASYTHQAALGRFPESQYELRPQTGIPDVFNAVQSGQTPYGVVPFENSSNGSVVFTLDLFADLKGQYQEIVVCGEIYLPVEHCLLGHAPKQDGHVADVSGQATPTTLVPQPGKPRARPKYDLKNVTKLYSHPQAWGQCKVFLSTYLKGTERQDVSSTSKAAEEGAKDSTGTSAAIASKLAAELNGLDVLAEGIEDTEGNSTRFFVLHRQHDEKADSDDTPDEDDEDGFKSLVSFTVNHGEPGALADCLAVCKQHDRRLTNVTLLLPGKTGVPADVDATVKIYGLNLTSINTRPSGEAPWHYIFFVEFMGRKRREGGAVKEALDELEKVAQSCRWLGSWQNALRAHNT